MKHFWEILFMALNVIAVCWEGERDAQKRDRHIYINHPKNALIRTTGWILASFIVQGISWPIHWGAVKFTLLLSSEFFLLFDYAYNFFANEPWYHLGTNELDMIEPKPSQKYIRLAGKMFFALFSHLLYYLT